MATLKLRYVHAFRDRHGTMRHYVRRPGRKRVALPGLPGAAAFMAAYQDAFAGGDVTPKEIGAARSQPGSVAAAVTSYLQSVAFLDLAPSSRRARRRILERFRERKGALPVAGLDRDHVERLVAKMAATPAAAHNFLKALRALMRHAIAAKLRRDDPTLGVKGFRQRAGGIHTWTEAEIAQFEARHPIGTKARLALALLLYTAQRRGDVVGMGPQHLRDGALAVRQQKTGAQLAIPLHAELAAVIAATPGGPFAFLTTQAGLPFTAAGFGNWFREKCRDAGLPEACSAHGLRKAACRRLAEAGCSANVIAAISGHVTLAEVQRYTKAADQKRLAASGMATVATAFPQAARAAPVATNPERPVATPPGRVARSPKLSRKINRP